ncbi:MAG: ribosome maturation factor RimP [Clostridia bacterium]|nr:ribosome maturation factor RimP [Clostridia bacterium]
MKFKSVEEITSTLLPTATAMGIEIVEVEAKVTKNPYLTVYIDTEDGVDLDTCEKFHNAIDPILDDFDPSFGASYTLNVSSPGLDRPLKTDRDFQKRIGCDVEIKLFAPLKGKKYFECKLVDYDGNNVVIEDGEEQIKLPLVRIAKINEAVKFD